MGDWWKNVIGEWWEGLSTLNMTFYGFAAFFSIFFVWQLLAAIVGWGGDEADGGAPDELDIAEDADIDVDEGDVGQSTVSFRLFSLRGLITFFTLFTWGGALYLNQGTPVVAAMWYSVLWGVAGMVAVALVIYALRKLTLAGTMDLKTCVGTNGTVYLTIPRGGVGEVRVTVSGTVTYVKARSADGRQIKAGTRVHVVRRVDQTQVEVRPLNEGSS